jgi:hypothetical protein
MGHPEPVGAAGPRFRGEGPVNKDFLNCICSGLFKKALKPKETVVILHRYFLGCFLGLHFHNKKAVLGVLVVNSYLKF